MEQGVQKGAAVLHGGAANRNKESLLTDSGQQGRHKKSNLHHRQVAKLKRFGSGIHEARVPNQLQDHPIHQTEVRARTPHLALAPV